jgi:hypothetical protein
MTKILSGFFERRVVVALALLAAMLLGLFLFSRFGGASEQEAKPDLLLMSSIPLQWGDADMADIASGQAQPSPLYQKLGELNKIVLLDDFQTLGSPGRAPLLLVQPRALAPRELVQLDNWVREGGSAIIFADPALDWPSDLPLGDQRRPLFTSLLTPMFRHWGLELALPVSDISDDPEAIIGEYRVAPKSAGIWLTAKNDKASAKCVVRTDQVIALCTVGKGRALLVADADLLHEELWTDGIMAQGTMAWLGALIQAMQSRDSLPAGLWEFQGK